MRYLIVLFLFLYSQASFSKIKRIDEKEIDLSKPFRIYMTSGRSTILEFPCEINHTVLGLEEEIKLKTGPDNKRTLALWLMSPSVQPTNLTVKCDEEYYVFDIIPNNHNHQDFIDIVDAYDSRTHRELKLIASSKAKTREIKNSEFEVNEGDLLYEIKKSKKSQKKINDDLILKALNKNSKPKKYVRTITTKELIEEMEKTKKSEKEVF